MFIVGLVAASPSPSDIMIPFIPFDNIVAKCRLNQKPIINDVGKIVSALACEQ